MKEMYSLVHTGNIDYGTIEYDYDWFRGWNIHRPAYSSCIWTYKESPGYTLTII